MAAVTFDDLPDAAPAVSFDDLPEASHGVRFDDLPDAKPPTEEETRMSDINKRYFTQGPDSLTPEETTLRRKWVGAEGSKVLAGTILDPQNAFITDPAMAARVGLEEQTPTGIIPGSLDIKRLAKYTTPAIVAKEIQEKGLDAVRAETGAPVVTLPKPAGDTIAAGIVRGGLTVADALTTPENLAIMATIEGAPRALQRAAAAGFSGQMGVHLPEQVRDIASAKTPGETAQKSTEAVLTAAMAVLGGVHAIKGPKGEVLPKQDKLSGAAAEATHPKSPTALAAAAPESPQAKTVEPMTPEFRRRAEAMAEERLDAGDAGKLEGTIEQQRARLDRLRQTHADVRRELEHATDPAEQRALRSELDDAEMKLRELATGEKQAGDPLHKGITLDPNYTPSKSEPLTKPAATTPAPPPEHPVGTQIDTGWGMYEKRPNGEWREVDERGYVLSDTRIIGTPKGEVTFRPEPLAEPGAATREPTPGEALPKRPDADYEPAAQALGEQVGQAKMLGYNERANINTEAGTVTPEVEQRLRAAAQAIESETGFPDVSIADVAERAGFTVETMPEAKGALVALANEGKLNLGGGDWSLGNPRSRAWSVLQGGDPAQYLRFEEAADAAKPSKPVTSNDWSTASLPDLAENAKPVEPPKSGVTLGAAPKGFTELTKLTDIAKAVTQKVVSAIRDIPKFHDFRKSVLNWSARNQKSSGEILKAAHDITKAVPDQTRREAITNWIQAGGDVAELARREAATTDRKLKAGYKAAQNLTPEETALAGKVRETYDILLNRARENGIEISEIENYVNQIWKRQPLRDFLASSNRKLSTTIRFAKQRYYDSFFHGEQNGLKPDTKDIAKLLPIYMNEVNNAISSKLFVAEMAKGKASDGRPLLAPRGGGKILEGEDGGKTQLVFPEQATKDTADYRPLDQPALHSWKWAGTDEAGNTTLVRGDLAVHPEAYSHLKNVLGQSAIREWYRSPSETPLGDIPKAATKFLLDDVQQIAKATMLGFLSPFHQVQEGTHAIGHKVNPFGNIPKIDLSKPEQMDAARHGLMLLPDRVSANQFREGLDGSSRNLAANLIGKAGKPGEAIKQWSEGYQNYLFHEYIPGLKLKTYEHILDRNMKRYVDELASGEVTPDQIKYLSAEQSNAAYGHLNYADLGRNPTIQHLAQTFLLAPDFLEARGRFAGQAVKGATGKVGREQLAAIFTLAVAQFITARVLNQAADGDPHWDEPFAVIHGNRKYTMRSVPEDIYKATKDTRRFISGRLSPIVGRGLLEGLSGVNYRGEPTTVGETFTNIMSSAVPLTLQPATRGLSETGKDNPVSPIEQLIGSMGLHVSRFSPTSEIYHLSKEWTEKHGKEYGLDKRRAVFPVSKYQQLRYALEDSDAEKAKKEIQQLMTDEKVSRAELDKRFKMSMNHPFTGSADTDAIFKKSLDDRGKKVFDAAVTRRALLVKRLTDLK